MKQIIRRGTFETNSSSTHTLTLLAEDQFNKWKTGEVRFLSDNNGILGDLDYNTVYSLDELVKGVRDFCSKKHEYNWKEEDKVEFLTHHKISDISELSDDAIKFYLIDNKRNLNLLTYDEYCDYNSTLEVEAENYTTPGGEKLVAVCAFGYDG